MNQSFELGVLRLDWRIVTVKPIYKSSYKFGPGNYRLISLTSLVRKTRQSLHSSIDLSQRSLFPAICCIVYLIGHWGWLVEIQQVTAYLDFSKSFDLLVLWVLFYSGLSPFLTIAFSESRVSPLQFSMGSPRAQFQALFFLLFMLPISAVFYYRLTRFMQMT